MGQGVLNEKWILDGATGLQGAMQKWILDGVTGLHCEQWYDHDTKTVSFM